MNKKIMRLGIVVLFLTFALVCPVFADFAFEKIYTTDGPGSVNPVTNFGWNETPWLYLRLPFDTLNVTGAWWISPASLPYLTMHGPSIDRNIWIELTGGRNSEGMPVSWADVRETGLWTIAAGYEFPLPNPPPLVGYGGGITNFTVTPEPISSFLFLTGGLTMLVAAYRKKSDRGKVLTERQILKGKKP